MPYVGGAAATACDVKPERAIEAMAKILRAVLRQINVERPNDRSTINDVLAWGFIKSTRNVPAGLKSIDDLPALALGPLVKAILALLVEIKPKFIQQITDNADKILKPITTVVLPASECDLLVR